jgi:hypothetical protein
LGKALSEIIGRETVSKFLSTPDPKGLFQKAEEIQKKMENLRQEISKLRGNQETITQNITNLKEEINGHSRQRQELQDQLVQEIPKENPNYREFWQIADRQGPYPKLSNGVGRRSITPIKNFKSMKTFVSGWKTRPPLTGASPLPRSCKPRPKTSKINSIAYEKKSPASARRKASLRLTSREKQNSQPR